MTRPGEIVQEPDESRQRPRTGLRILRLLIGIMIWAAGVAVVVVTVYLTDPMEEKDKGMWVRYRTTKRFNQTCWWTEEETEVLPGWGNKSELDWEKEKVWLNENQGKYITYLTEASVRKWIGQLKDQSLISQEQQELWNNIAHRFHGHSLVKEIHPSKEGLVIHIFNVTRLVKEEVRCNWIETEQSGPQFYCNLACIPIETLVHEGYWQTNWVRPAPNETEACEMRYPQNDTFWGDLDLTCNKSEASQGRKKTRWKTSEPVVEKLPTPVPRVSVVEQFEPNPNNLGEMPTTLMRGGNHLDMTQARAAKNNEIWERCVDTKRGPLLKQACLWNLDHLRSRDNPSGCSEGPLRGPHLVLSPVYRTVVYSIYYSSPYTLPGLGGESPTIVTPWVSHEKWLNDTFPWVWKISVTHLTTAFVEGTMLTGDMLVGPKQQDMYVQRLPTPQELMTVPQDDFRKIDECVTEKAFADLNGTNYVRHEAVRCELWQVWQTTWGYWKHDCTYLKGNRTMKGALEVWNDGQRVGWGLQESEVRKWVIPCLQLSSNYWVKYQYLATVYSKDKDVKPRHLYYDEGPTVMPRPWKLTCDRENTTCTVELARGDCTGIEQWETECNLYYAKTHGKAKENYQTHRQGAQWVRHEGQWTRVRLTWPERLGCAKSLLDLMFKRHPYRNIEIVPYVANPYYAQGEGFAFRHNLCEGKEIRGFGWLGPNKIYNKGTCTEPVSHWLKCNTFGEHDCTYVELAFASAAGAAGEVFEEVGEAVEKGVEAAVGWLGSLLKKLWPFLLAGAGLLIAVVLTISFLRGSFMVMVKKYLNSGKIPLLDKAKQQLMSKPQLVLKPPGTTPVKKQNC